MGICDCSSRERKYKNEYENITGVRPLILNYNDYIQLEQVILLKKILHELKELNFKTKAK